MLSCGARLTLPLPYSDLRFHTSDNKHPRKTHYHNKVTIFYIKLKAAQTRSSSTLHDTMMLFTTDADKWHKFVMLTGRPGRFGSAPGLFVGITFCHTQQKSTIIWSFTAFTLLAQLCVSCNPSRGCCSMSLCCLSCSLSGCGLSIVY